VKAAVAAVRRDGSFFEPRGYRVVFVQKKLP